MYEQVMEQGVAEENFRAALQAVKRNQGAPGIDRMTTAQLEAHHIFRRTGRRYEPSC